MGRFIRLEIRKHIAWLSIDRPEAYNALSRQVVDELDTALDHVAADRDIKVLVIKSRKNFASGADIREMADLTPGEALNFSFGSTFDKLARMRIPTVAAIEGFALGGGMELALACDFRIACADARLGFPEITLGIMPGAGGTFRLPQLIGEAKAKELIYLGKQITAKEALDIGLVNRVENRDCFCDSVEKLAECLSAKSSAALAAAKQTIEENLREPDFGRASDRERRNWSALFEGPDQKEGMEAFLEKRKPKFRH